MQEQGKTTAAIDTTIPAELETLKEQISASTEQVYSSIGYTAYSYTQSAVACLCYQCHQPGHLQRSRAVFLVWPVWTPGKGLPVGK